MAGAIGTFGRKTMEQRFALPITAAERKIIDWMPEMLDKMHSLAMGRADQPDTTDGSPIRERKPNLRALEYLLNRILGQPPKHIAVIDPQEDPYEGFPSYEEMIKMDPAELVKLHQQMNADS